jgi:hypothetical protein
MHMGKGKGESPTCHNEPRIVGVEAGLLAVEDYRHVYC